MSIHNNEILDYLDEHPIGCYEGGVKSLMEMLHDVYIEHNSVDSEEIHRLLQRFQDLLEQNPLDSRDALYGLVSDLCREHEVLAFSHGIVVGMYLMSEARTLP